MADIYDILTSLGYRLRDNGQYYRTAPIYRDCSNQTEMVIRKDNGVYIDFGNTANPKGSFQKLVRLTVGDEEAVKILADFDADAIANSRPEIVIPKKIIYDRSVLSKLLPMWELYLEDGLSEETMRTFEVGFKPQDHLYNRYCFPIYNETGDIIGFAGRHRTKQVPSGVSKWKLNGHKKDWLWPLHLNLDEIKNTQEIILVESPNCVFHLWEAGIKNVICLFGVEMSPKIFNFLIRQQPKRIIIATNNDSINGGSAGEIAAKTIEGILTGFFANEKIVIHLPTRKDFGEMPKPEIHTWRSQLPII